MCWKIEIHVKLYYSQDIINSTYIKCRIYISIHLLMLFGKITTRYVLKNRNSYKKLHYLQDIINRIYNISLSFLLMLVKLLSKIS